jgi:hypothetical protein
VPLAPRLVKTLSAISATLAVVCVLCSPTANAAAPDSPASSPYPVDPAVTQLNGQLTQTQKEVAQLAVIAAQAKADAEQASIQAGDAASAAIVAENQAKLAQSQADLAQKQVNELVSTMYRQGPVGGLETYLAASNPSDLLQISGILDQFEESSNVALTQAQLAWENAKTQQAVAQSEVLSAQQAVALAQQEQQQAEVALTQAETAASTLTQNLKDAIMLTTGLPLSIPVDGTLLQKASALKDVRPFAVGSGPNSNGRMKSWLASDRTVNAGTPRAYAVEQLTKYGWDLTQWPCLDRMWWHESSWSPYSVDRSQGSNFDPSKTWGIPQAFPASKMGNTSQGGGPDWVTNPETQINWGLTYIQRAYGSPCQAWASWRARAATGRSGWY